MTTRITASYVTDMAKHAEMFTDGAFRYGYTSNPGDGTHYVDGIEQRVWFTSREAAAYYMGAMLGWARATGTEIPADVAEFCRPMRDLVAVSDKLQQEQERGESTAVGRAEVRASRDA